MQDFLQVVQIYDWKCSFQLLSRAVATAVQVGMVTFMLSSFNKVVLHKLCGGSEKKAVLWFKKTKPNNDNKKKIVEYFFKVKLI